jgi:hypothetical protein
MVSPLDKETQDALDTLFNVWLAEHGMMTKDGVIYAATKDGHIKQDKTGQWVRVNPDVLRRSIRSQQDGFAQYVQKHAPSIRITLRENPFPEQ